MRIARNAVLLAIVSSLPVVSLGDDVKPAPASSSVPDAQTQLVDAIHRADPAAMDRALKAGAVLSQTSAASQSAIEALVKVGTAEVYSVAVKAGLNLRDLEVKRWTPVDLLLHRPWSRASDLKYLLDQGVDPAGGVWGDRTLQSVAAASNVEIARLLVEHGAEVNPAMSGDGYTPLTFAFAVGTPDVVRFLHSKKATPDDDGIQPYTAALAQPDPRRAAEMIALAKELGYKPDEDLQGFSPLMLAARSGKTEIVDLLISAGADVNTVGAGKMTAMLYAASMGSVETIASLIKAKASVNVVDSYGFTPLHNAIRAANPSSIFRDHAGNSHFIEAVYSRALWRDHVAAIRLLVEAGADVNAADPYGFTPLTYAVNAGDPFWLREDLQFSKQDESRRPLAYLGQELCAQLDATAIVRLLVERGATRRTGLNAIDALDSALRRTDERAADIAALVRTAKIDPTPQPKPKPRPTADTDGAAPRKQRSAPSR